MGVDGLVLKAEGPDFGERGSGAWSHSICVQRECQVLPSKMDDGAAVQEARGGVQGWRIMLQGVTRVNGSKTWSSTYYPTYTNYS